MTGREDRHADGGVAGEDAGGVNDPAARVEKLYDCVRGPVAVAVYACAADGGVADPPRGTPEDNVPACRFEIRVNGKLVAVAASQMEAEQEARRIAEEGTVYSSVPGTTAGPPVTLTPAQASDLAADVALANESLTAARLLLATDRVGDGAGNTVEGYLSEAQESARRLYSALVAARGILPATVRTGATAAEGERRRLLYLLEQAREIADRFGSAGGAEAASYAESVGALASRLRAELADESVAEYTGPATA